MNPIENKTESSDAAAPRRSVLFRHPDFMKLWAGETVSLFGTRMGDVAISFAAVIALKATPFQIGLLAAAGTVPTLVMSLFVGVWVDRIRRRPILIATDIARTIALGTIPLAALFGALRMTQLYAVMLLDAVLDLFFSVAYRSYLPTLVNREDLVDAKSVGELFLKGLARAMLAYSVCRLLGDRASLIHDSADQTTISK